MIYIFKCSSCNATYIGNTKRHQKVRFSEHIGVSPRTGKMIKPTLVNASKVKEHIIQNQHKCNLEDFKVLSIGGHNNILQIKESIAIKTMKPSLNDNTTSRELFLFN